MLVFGAWPQFWDLSQSGLTPAGLFWYGPATYFARGDEPWYHEFHWHGLQLLAGNLFVLAGLAALAAFAVARCGSGAAGLAPRMSDELDRLRDRLASRVITVTRIRSDLVAAALRAVPRHLFLPDLPPEAAYRDDAIVTKRDADGQGISSSSQPAIMAIMLDQLDLAPGHRVLEIGAGTGYNAALIAHIVGPSGQVVSVDIDADTGAGAAGSPGQRRIPGRHRGMRGRR